MQLSQSSRLSYGSSNIPGRHTPTNSAQRSNRTIGFPDDHDLALETFINSLQLDTFFTLMSEEQDERLQKIDALELFKALQDKNRELGLAKLENYFLTDFLEKTDPKLLIGLQQRRSIALSESSPASGAKIKDSDSRFGKSFGGSSGGGNRRGSIQKSMATTTMSFTTATSSGGGGKRSQMDYRLNYKAKADMAEKTGHEAEKRVRELERNAIYEIKQLRGQMEEMHIVYDETVATARNFQLHFRRDEEDLRFLNAATERQLERKIKMFINNWIKNARALLATMRLKITAQQENCQHLRGELLTKADLSGILTAIDFEKLIIKRTELLQTIEEKYIHMTGLKAVTGKASLTMTEEKQIMMQLEEESKKLSNRTKSVVKTIGKLEKEANSVEADNANDQKILKELRFQLRQFEAPSISEYIAKKDILLALEKEEQMLLRKVHILKMKLDNVQKNYKRTKVQQ